MDARALVAHALALELLVNRITDVRDWSRTELRVVTLDAAMRCEHLEIDRRIRVLPQTGEVLLVDDILPTKPIEASHAAWILERRAERYARKAASRTL